MRRPLEDRNSKGYHTLEKVVFNGREFYALIWNKKGGKENVENKY